MPRTAVLPTLLALATLASPARAIPVAYGSGLVSPAVTIDFAGLSDGTVIGGTYAGLGVTFSGLIATSRFGSTLGSTTAPAAANFASGQPTSNIFTISFSTVVSDAEFFLNTDGYTTTISSTLAGTTVETVTAGQYATNGSDYFGFTGSAFDGITISVGGSGAAVIDNVEFSYAAVQSVPEPATPGMMLAGLAGLVGLGARRRS